MTIRFTLSEKWQDKWFRNLKPAEKLLFLYICDNCNIAGIWEIDLDLASYFISIPLPEVKGALKGLARGYELLDNDHLWLKNFLKHQRNMPLNINNLAHASIINLLIEYKDLSSSILELLSTDDIIGATKGLESPISKSKGISKGKSVSKSVSKEKKETEVKGDWLNDLDIEEATPINSNPILTLWNTFAKNKAYDHPSVDMEISRLHQNGITDADIIKAIENYRDALSLTRSQAHPHKLGKFLSTHLMKSYIDTKFDISIYNPTTFEKKVGDDSSKAMDDYIKNGGK